MAKVDVFSRRAAGRPLVVVGASAAGVAAVEAARESGYDGPVLLLSAEDRAPYKRTKISKTIVDEPAHDAFALHEPQWYREQGVELRTNSNVREVDPHAGVVRLADGSNAAYGALVLALGSEPVSPDIEGADRIRFHHPYTQAAVERLARAVQSRLVSNGSCRVTIFGCGFTGLEVADQLWRMGAGVTLVARGPRFMRGALDRELEGRLRTRMEENGVRVYYGGSVAATATPSATASADNPSGDNPSGDATLSADEYVLACGLSPRSIPGVGREAWPGDRQITDRGASSPPDQSVAPGIPVDAQLRAEGHEAIFACGDCARHPDGRVTWLWRHAKQQGAVAGENAAAVLTGNAPLREYRYVPFRLKSQLFGDYYFSITAAGYETVDVDNRAPDHVDRRSGDAYRALWVRDGRVVRVIMANDKDRADEYMAAVVEGWSPEKLLGVVGVW